MSKGRSVGRTFARNIASNAGGYLVNIIVAFTLSPFIVRTLGDSAFGLWTLITSFTGVYGLLDLGVRSAVAQYVTRYLAVDDLENANKTMGTALVLGSVAAGLIVTAAIVLTIGAPYWFDLGGHPLDEARTAILISGGTVALTFPAAIFGTITYAKQRFDVENGLAVSSRLISAALTVVVLKAGYGIVGLAVVTMSADLMTTAGRMFAAYRLVPGLKVSPRLYDPSSRKQLLSFGGYNVLVNAADRVMVSTSAIVIAFFLSTEAVTYYSVGSNLVPYYMQLVNTVAWTLTPQATSLDARGDREGLRQLYLKGSRGILLLSAFIGAGLLTLGRDFLGVWMGPRFISGESQTSSATILVILTCATLIRTGMTTGKQILFGQGKVRTLAGVAIWEAGINLALSVALVLPFGLPGVAFATLIPMVILQGIVQPLIVMRAVAVGAGTLLKEVVVRAIPTPLVMGAAAFLVAPHIEATNWPAFLIKATVVAAPGFVVALLFGLTSDERQVVLRKLRR